jgi:hypothetical protein
MVKLLQQASYDATQTHKSESFPMLDGDTLKAEGVTPSSRSVLENFARVDCLLGCIC